MKIPALPLALALTALPVHAAEPVALTPVSVDAHNEAAGFAGTLKFAIGRAARDCRDLLHRDDAWMQAIVGDWLSRNGRYAQAAELWTSVLLTHTARHDGMPAAEALHRDIMDTVERNAAATVDTLLGSDAAARTAACAGYPALVTSGRLDITRDMPQYAAIDALTRWMEQAAP